MVIGNGEDRTLSRAYPRLNNLFGAYLHQDWEYGFNWENHESHFRPVIRYFKTHNSPAVVEQATTELKQFIAERHDENQLDEYLSNDFGLEILPSYWGFTFQGFLEDVLKILEEPMEKTKREWIPEFIG